jgi:hypothetical protein
MARDGLLSGKSPRECIWCRDTDTSATGYLEMEAVGSQIYIDYGLFRKY